MVMFLMWAPSEPHINGMNASQSGRLYNAIQHSISFRYSYMLTVFFDATSIELLSSVML